MRLPQLSLALLALLVAPGCRAALPLATPGPLVRAAGPATPRSARATRRCDARCLTWCCGPDRGRVFRKRWRLSIEAGPVWQSRNDLAIPGDTGTRFALDEVTGSGPFPWGRVTLEATLAPRHSVRAVIAPLDIETSGRLDREVSFDGQTFAAGAPTTARYKFNSYRLSYRYLLACGDDWSFYVGATAKIRDAAIELRQGAASARDTDLGFVPLAHLGFERRLGRGWHFAADLDAAAAPQGRAFDLSLRLGYDLNARWRGFVGYRTLEGGADNDSVYTFAWLHQVFLGVETRF